MSAGSSGAGPTVDADLEKLAPRFRAAVEASLAACQAAGLDAKVFEGLRSAELQALYYARGRTVIPPSTPVTNAQSNLDSWHGYGLAVDVISASKLWDMPESWFEQVATIFKAHGCAWGGDWKQRDTPHFQWGRCKPSPSPLAHELIAAQGMRAVWQAVGADDFEGAGAAVPASAPSPTFAAVSAPPPVPAAAPPDIAALQLNANAEAAAMILKARFPSTVFTSGRRSVAAQAQSMASDVVRDRRFIIETYKPSVICTACQQWVDAHPEAVTQAALGTGILGVFQAAAEADVMTFSKHLTGDAFDVLPVDANADQIIAFIQQLPLLEKFLPREAQLIRWHAQFYR